MSRAHTDELSRSVARPLPRSLVATAAILGAVLVLAGDAYHLFVLDDRASQAGTVAYSGHGIGIMLGLVMLVLAALSVTPTGPLARVGLPTMVLGTTLVIGDIWAEVVVLPGVLTPESRDLLANDIAGVHLTLVVVAYALFAVGWVLVALAVKNQVGLIAWLLVLGGVVAFLPIGGSYVLLAVGAALVVSRATRAA